MSAQSVTVAAGAGVTRRSTTADLDIVVGGADIFVRSWVDGGPGARVAVGFAPSKRMQRTFIAPGVVVSSGEVRPSIGLTQLISREGSLVYTNHLRDHQVFGAEWLHKLHRRGGVKVSADYHAVPGRDVWGVAIGLYVRLK